jgi:hypothetical protein
MYLYMDNFHYKYLKYKKKYFNLRKDLIGGNKPSTIILKNINLLTGREKDYLDPTIGYIWSLNAIKNYYLFGEDNNKITKLVKLLYQHATIDTLIHKTVLERKVTPYQIGYLLGKWYNYLFNLPIIESIILKYIQKNKVFTPDEINVLNAIKNNYNKKEKQQIKITDDQNERKIKKYKQDENLKIFCRMDEIENKIREDTYKPKYKDYIKQLTLNNIKDYKKNIVDNSSKVDNNIGGKSFRQQFNKILNKETFDRFKKMFEDIELNINRYAGYSSKIEELNDMKKYYLIELKGIFAVTLSFLWSIAKNKQGIKEYYEGLYQHIYNPELELLIKGEKQDFFENYIKSDLEVSEANDFNQVLALFNNKVKGSLSFQGTKNIQLYGNSFGDCNETAIKNFIKLLIYNENTGTFDLNILTNLGANQSSDIYQFFEKFNTDQDHISNISKNINGVDLTVRQAWTKIMSNIDNVNYKGGKNFEIYPGKSVDGKKNNIEVILGKLFNIKSFSELENKVVGLKIEETNSPTNINITFKETKYKFYASSDEHMDFELVESQNNFKFKEATNELIKRLKLNSYQQIILYSYKNLNFMFDKIFSRDYKKLYQSYQYFYFLNIDRVSMYILINTLFPLDGVEELNENLVKLINDKKLYNKVYQIIRDNLTPDEKERMCINFSKLNQSYLADDFTSYEGTKYDKTNQSLDLHLTGFTCPIKKLGISLSPLTNLQKLKLHSIHEVDVRNSFDNLTNLKELDLSNTYVKNLYPVLIDRGTLKLPKKYTDVINKEDLTKLKQNKNLTIEFSKY